VIDECHLLHQDICGKQWNFIKNPIKIKIGDYQERQTYFGVMDLMKGEFTYRQEILELLRQGNKIQAIKLYRSLTQSGLKESKEAIEQLESEI
jgi:hypothetical protein